MAYLNITMTESLSEEGCHSSQEIRQRNEYSWNQDWMGMGHDKERRKTYSTKVIDDVNITSMIYVRDSIVKMTDATMNMDDDIAMCLPGARIEHVTEKIEQILGRGYGGSILVHIER